jgi:predicted RecB family nuclease
MLITTDLVEAFLHCPTKCYLRACGVAETGNAYAEWVRIESDLFRSEGIKALVAGVGPDKCAIGIAATESGGPAQWRLAVDLVAQAENLQSSCHAVERIPSAGRGHGLQFVPIRFVFRNKLSRRDRLLLAFDALAISKGLGCEVTLGRIVHGDAQVTAKLKLSALKNEVADLIDKIAVLISSPAPPDLVLNRHCAECEFQTSCRQKAINKDDLSLLGGMTEKERADFNSKGIFTVAQLSFTFRPPRWSPQNRP